MGNIKKKILFLSLHRPDRSPSQRFRFEQYITFLEANGFECKHSFVLNENSDKYYYQPGNYLKKATLLLKATLKRLWESLSNKYDIILVNRECYMLGTTIFERIFSWRSKMVFDFDDAIWMRQTGQSNSGNKFFHFLKGKSKTAKLIQLSDMVFAGNKYLAEYASVYNDNVIIITPTIDTDLYTKVKDYSSPKERICVGWSGSFSTITFFEYAVPALYEIKKKYGNKVYFKIIGDSEYRNTELDIRGLPWNKQTELYDLSEIDIGIMPLPDDEWTKGKCGLKGLQYMALGIPTIMSPVGINTEIINDGENGFLASNTEEWVLKISLLIDSLELRKKFSEEGRKTIEEKHSVKAYQGIYLKAFNQLSA